MGCWANRKGSLSCRPRNKRRINVEAYSCKLAVLVFSPQPCNSLGFWFSFWPPGSAASSVLARPCPSARQPPAHLLVVLHHPHRELRVAPEPGTLSPGFTHVFARVSPQKPELRLPQEPELQPASSPGSKRALTRLWFRIGGGKGQEAGARDSRRTIGLDVYRSY